MADKTTVYCQNPECGKKYKIKAPPVGRELPDMQCPHCQENLSFRPPTVETSESDQKRQDQASMAQMSRMGGWNKLQRDIDNQSVNVTKRLMMQIVGMSAFLIAITVVFFLIRGKATDVEPIATAKLPRDIRVVVTPPHADITIDGKPPAITNMSEDAKGELLLTIAEDDAKQINIQAKGYEPYRTIIAYSSSTPLKIDLRPIIKPFQVSSTPPGATLLLDGEKVGKTPTSIHVNMSLDSVTLNVELVDHQPMSRVIATDSLSSPSEPILFELTPSADSLAKSRWIKLLHDNRMAEQAGSYTPPTIHAENPWEEKRTDGKDFVFSPSGDQMAITTTAETVSFATDFGPLAMEVPIDATAWIETRDGRIILRTNLGDTFVGVLADESLAYESAPGTPKNILPEQVRAFVFRRRLPAPPSDSLTTVVLWLGRNTFLATDLEGSIEIKSDLGATTIAATNIHSIRRTEDPKDHIRVLTHDESSVTGKLVKGELSAKLLCNGTRVPIDATQIKALEVGPSEFAIQMAAQEEKMKAQQDLLDAALAAAEGTVTQKQGIIDRIESKNRALVLERNDATKIFRDKVKKLTNEHKAKERSNRKNGTRTPRLKLPKAKDDPKIARLNGELQENGRQLSQAKKELTKARRAALNVKKQIEQRNGELGAKEETKTVTTGGSTPISDQE